MADYMIVAGDANQYVKKMFEKQKDINIVNTFLSVESLSMDVLNNGTSFLQVVKSVIVLDFGFTSPDAKGRALEFTLLQDTLQSNSLQETKLYLITRDTNLYDTLRGEIDGVPGVHYINTEVLLIEGEYAPKLLGDIFKGRRDRTGLYHPEVDRVNLANRLKDDRDVFIQDSKSVSREILRYGKDMPVSELSKTDFTDSKVTENKIIEREKQLARERKLAERKARQMASKPVHVDKGSNTTIGSPKGQQESSNVSVRVTDEVDEDTQQVRGMPNLRRMQKAFESIGRTTVLKGKLEQDEGVIAFIGERKSGTSGVVANVADIYAMSGRTVLIIDADIVNRSQTLYFGNYDEQVSKHYGVGNGLVKVTQGGTIQRTAVQITSRVSILGVSRSEKVTEDMVKDVATELGTIIEDARSQYDIVLVDVPYEQFGLYIEGLESTDKNLLVVENRWYDIENFISLSMRKHLEGNEEAMVNFFKKSSIILNKFKRGRIDVHGRELDRYRMVELLRGAGYPYDLIGVAGEIPYYDNWENQYLTRVRYIWTDELAMGVYKQLFSKVVW